MIDKGMILRCKTTTKDDIFGIVLWEVVETGLPAPEKDRRNMYSDGVKVVMLGGSGPSSRPGMTIIDSEWHIMEDIKKGVTTIVPNTHKDECLSQIQKKKVNPIPRHGGNGVVELN